MKQHLKDWRFWCLNIYVYIVVLSILASFMGCMSSCEPWPTLLFEKYASGPTLVNLVGWTILIPAFFLASFLYTKSKTTQCVVLGILTMSALFWIAGSYF